MKIVENTAFEPHKDLRHEALVVHKRRGSHAGTLAVFVHGLGGRRYETWQRLPWLILEDFPLVDVALFDYVSGTRRFWPRLSVDLDTTARELADIVRDVPYERVVLLGHSMGGLLCQAAIKDLLDSGVLATNKSPAIRRVAGLFLLATPQAGSKIAWLAGFTKDGRILRPFSPFVTELAERFTDRIQMHGHYDPVTGIISIPTFALTATKDRWVTRFSSQLHLPRQNRKVSRGSHSSIVKPKSRDSDGYRWLRQKLDLVIQESQRADHGTISMDKSEIDKLMRSIKYREMPTSEGQRVYGEHTGSRAGSGTVRSTMAQESDSVRLFMGEASTNLLSVSMQYSSDLPTAPVPPPGHALLYVRYGPTQGRRHTLDGSPQVVGRDPDSDICIDDGTVSRRHAEFRASTDGTFTVTDLGSTNGTYVNHEPIDGTTVLEAGDEVQIGKHRFIFLGPVD